MKIVSTRPTLFFLVSVLRVSCASLISKHLTLCGFHPKTRDVSATRCDGSLSPSVRAYENHPGRQTNRPTNGTQPRTPGAFKIRLGKRLRAGLRVFEARRSSRLDHGRAPIALSIREIVSGEVRSTRSRVRRSRRWCLAGGIGRGDGPRDGGAEGQRERVLEQTDGGRVCAVPR